MVLAVCTSCHNRLAVYKISFIYPQYFWRYALDKLIMQKLGRQMTVITWFMHSAILLMTLYQYIKFYLIPFYTFRDMHRIK